MARQLTETVKARIDAETLDALKRRAVETDRTVGAVIRRALREHLNPKEAHR